MESKEMTAWYSSAIPSNFLIDVSMLGMFFSIAVP